MLLEMATGNFFYRLERSAKNDHLEAISISLNMLAEEIQEAMLHDGYVNSNDALVEIIQMSFIIDHKGIIKTANQQSCNILSILHVDLIEHPFENFLTETSQLEWQKVWNKLNQKTLYDTNIKLEFKTQGSLIIPKTCYITTFLGKTNEHRQTLITAIHHSRSHEQLDQNLKRHIQEALVKNDSTHHTDANKKPKIKLSFEDIRKIRTAHDIIINNLEKDFPSLKTFALQIGTNEFKLKYGFKELYGISVYRFLIQERLRKSKMMIQYTNQSLKTIAQMIGFKSIAHFSRTFKKQYGYAPSALRKKTLEQDS